MDVKDCPGCGAEIPKLLGTCCHCGYRFPGEKGFTKITCPVHGVICHEEYQMIGDRAEVIAKHVPEMVVSRELRDLLRIDQSVKICLPCFYDFMKGMFPPLKMETEAGEGIGLFQEKGEIPRHVFSEKIPSIMEEVPEQVSERAYDSRLRISGSSGFSYSRNIKSLVFRPGKNPQEWKKLHIPREAQFEGWDACCDGPGCRYMLTSRTPRFEVRGIRTPSDEERVEMISERPYAELNQELFFFCSVECLEGWAKQCQQEVNIGDGPEIIER